VLFQVRPTGKQSDGVGLGPDQVPRCGEVSSGQRSRRQADEPLQMTAVLRAGESMIVCWDAAASA
jgi:hypothetical protein